MGDQNVFLALNDSQSLQDGEEMVVITDEGMGMNTLQSLLNSGAVQTLNNDDEIIQVTDSNMLGDAIVQLEGESYHVISDENGQTYLAPINQLGGSSNITQEYQYYSDTTFAAAAEEHAEAIQAVPTKLFSFHNCNQINIIEKSTKIFV